MSQPNMNGAVIDSFVLIKYKYRVLISYFVKRNFTVAILCNTAQLSSLYITI